tara:strand:+ start:576 stop:812 length:237 start_codon:yes stop_codon:yes gene_type:complete
MSDLKLEDLQTEKERLVSDRKALVDRLQELQSSSEQIKTQVQAIGGAIQTCDYFIGKLQPPQESEESAVEETVEEDDS